VTLAPRSIYIPTIFLLSCGIELSIYASLDDKNKNENENENENEERSIANAIMRRMMHIVADRKGRRGRRRRRRRRRR
jgi:hypothetical protein